MLRIKAPAKLNLALHITGKRADGYHNLSSLVVFTEFGDEITLEEAEFTTIKFEGEFALGINHTHNSLLDALSFLKARKNFSQNFHIHVQKNIPVQAGLGGGTADAAALLRVLSAHYNLGQFEFGELAHLGADVPVSYFNAPALMGGIGERIEPVQLDFEKTLLLVNPGCAVSTGNIFQAMTDFAKPIPFQSKYDLDDVKKLANNMQEPAIAFCPEIKTAIDSLTSSGASLVRMSGSGATVFGVFDEFSQAKHASELIVSKHPNWWQKITQTMRSTT